jgi:L,D-transpeptidase YbiS
MRKRYWIILVAVLVLIPVVWALLPSNPPPLEPDLLVSVPSLVTETKEKLLLYRQDTLAACAETDPRRGASSKRPYIVIDTHTNRIYYRTQDSVLFSALCSTGSGAELVDSGSAREWRFNTPKGVFRIDSRGANPWWRKPDWAFIEEGEKPPKDEDERLDPDVLGDFALGFGDGFFIHGTLYERLIGVAVTHGCVRLYSQDIKRLYQVAKIGTPVIIF